MNGVSIRISEIAVADAFDRDVTREMTIEVAELDSPDHSLAANRNDVRKLAQSAKSSFHDLRHDSRFFDDVFRFEDVERGEHGGASQRMGAPGVGRAAIAEAGEDLRAANGAIDRNA